MVGKWRGLLLVVSAMILAGACTDSAERAAAEKEAFEKAARQPNAVLIEFIKKQKLANFPQATIGEAFDSYKHFASKEWKAESIQGGRFSVDYIGWFLPAMIDEQAARDGVTGRGLEVKFIIESTGPFYVFMISMIETTADGKLKRPQSVDMASTLARIYANEKIVIP